MMPIFYLKEKLLCQTNKYLFCYYKGFIVLRKSSDKSFIQKLRIQSFIKSVYFIERALRYEPRTAVCIGENNFLFSSHGYIYNYFVDSNSIVIEHEFDKRMNSPLSFCLRRDNSGEIIDLIYGEYIQNVGKTDVSIYRRRNGKWYKIFSFPPNSINHIHNIIYDKYRNRYIILTGDSDEESGIWKSDLNFEKVEPIAVGSQKYRACVAYLSESGIYYATDTPLEQNYIYKLCENNDGTITMKKLYDMPGPCIYGIVKNDGLYMATSVEGDPRQNKIMYYFSNKLGIGVKDKFVHIIKLSASEKIREITSFKKDILPMGLFQFGNVKFPFQDTNNKVYFCPQSCKSVSGTYHLNIND